MKKRLLLAAVSLLGFVAAKANSDLSSGPGEGKKDDINGIVTNADNKRPLRDVSVTAYLVTKKEKVVVTNDEGGFAFDELKPGVYKFVFEKAGFKRITKEKVVVKTDEAFQMNIEMIESNDFEITPSPFSFGMD